MSQLERIDREVRMRLEPGESPLLAATLRILKLRTGGTTFFQIAVVVRLIDELRNAFKMRKYRRQFAEHQFPIARRTMACLTERRMLLWKESTHPFKGFKIRYLGSVGRERIKSVSLAPGTNVNWNVMTLQLADGAQIRLLIHGEPAQKFVGLLSK